MNMNTHTLTRHRDIRDWVNDRRGQPALRRIPNQFGEVRSRLALKFARRDAAPEDMPALDDGVMPCSWSAWLAELDRQNLALKVADQGVAEYELVDRRGLH